ncbi:hypothetical protein E3O19_01395 [Cryobacterium algoritolerans]|uniref:Uncharacterized protein n=1 Tax=Cryobacterium algoritolerans TaxID=1259184 RepID=A0A4R8WY30_9MICO|nr:hypothetical protein [Cryobacterium algoritolerans]TFC20053.1 hypothetical protein E3O19_01395 [Cryobacterium algoritolerans]
MADPVTTSETRRRAVIAHAAVSRIAESYILEGDRNPARIIWQLTEDAESQITALMDIASALTVHFCTLLEFAAAEGPAQTAEMVQGIAKHHLESMIERAIDEQSAR